MSCGCSNVLSDLFCDNTLIVIALICLAVCLFCGPSDVRGTRNDPRCC